MSLIEQTEQTTTQAFSIGKTRQWYGRWGKRLLDIAVSGFVLLLIFPVFALVFAALWLQLGPGLLLHQRRVGQHGQVFSMLKLRTMESSRRETLDPEFDGPERRSTHKSRHDPRHTSAGRIARKFSLDEIPQLWNVLRGDMSLVGPRPELESVATADFKAHARHTVRPGLTGPYQVSELRRKGDLQPGLPLDAAYADAVTFRADVMLLLRTILVVARGTGS